MRITWSLLAKPVLAGLLHLATAGTSTPILTSPAAHAAVLHRGNDSDPETLDPHKTSTVAEANLLRDLYEGLVLHDMKADVAPGVAASWTISPDGLVYVFKLRTSPRWSNGDAVTAQDFVFSFRRLLDPATLAKFTRMNSERNGASSATCFCDSRSSFSRAAISSVGAT